MAKETAEQKLLKLIETTDSAEQASRQASGSGDALKVSEAVKGVGIGPVNLPPILQNLLAMFQKSPGQQSTASFGLRESNKILALGVLILAVIFITDFIKGMRTSREEVSFSLSETVESMAESMLPSFKEVANYVEVVSRRNIFHPYERKVVKEEKQYTEEEKKIKKLSEQSQNLKLVGISWLDTPESASAMIENTITGMTYFLGAGDQIQNITVKEIYADSITIMFEGQEMEMRL